jgi:fumarylacetoacetase
VPEEAYGVVADRDGACRVVAKLGGQVVALAPLAHAGALGVPTGTFDEPSLNRWLELGPAAWVAAREGLRRAAPEAPRTPADEVTPVLPVRVGDYVDCYSSLEHATNVGRLFRPDAEDPLPAAWRHLPIAYHGRAGTVVVSGTPVRRPCGMRGPGDFGPERRLDFELELGCIAGAGALFGAVLVNDWSAREIQRFEYQPLGPFLGKSFATSISPWVVPLDAVRLVPAPPQDPEPLPYLRAPGDWAVDVDLEVELNGEVVSRVNARGLYWTFPQQLAHATVNGAVARPGDLFASGTISGAVPGSEGSLIELGRPFLRDGDTVVLRGRSGSASFGEVRGTVQAA